MMKRCPKCGELKELSQFNKHKNRKDAHQSLCRDCCHKAGIIRIREVRGSIPMSENKECPSYLGVAIAERLVRHLFTDVVTMPNGNSGYDFVCNHDKKIDVKSACTTMNNKRYPYWVFNIRNNQVADYFLLLAFDSRENLTPLHQWLIPGNVLNHLIGTTISPSTIHKWDKFSQPIKAAQICCNAMKEM